MDEPEPPNILLILERQQRLIDYLLAARRQDAERLEQLVADNLRLRDLIGAVLRGKRIPCETCGNMFKRGSTRAKNCQTCRPRVKAKRDHEKWLRMTTAERAQRLVKRRAAEQRKGGKHV